MATYAYRCTAFMRTGEVIRRDAEIEGWKVEAHMREAGPLAFHKLLDRWNRESLANHLASPGTNHLFVYTAR